VLARIHYLVHALCLLEVVQDSSCASSQRFSLCKHVMAHKMLFDSAPDTSNAKPNADVRCCGSSLVLHFCSTAFLMLCKKNFQDSEGIASISRNARC